MTESRVRAVWKTQSGLFENIRSPRQYGVKGARLPCGVWGSAPTTNQPHRSYESEKTKRRDVMEVRNGSTGGMWVEKRGVVWVEK